MMIAALFGGALLQASAVCASIDDVRVEPLIETRWTQPLIEGRYVGCVATAGAQIMRYFECPKGEIPSFTNAYCAVEGVQTTLEATGGVYDWTKMPISLADDSDGEGSAEVLKLMRDLGVACGMDYKAVGSEVGGYMLSRAWTVHFGYRSVAAYTLDGDLPLEVVNRALVSNLDAGLPVEVGLTGPRGGHAVVVDGYGYKEGQLHFHLNFGWGGNYDGWYVLPRIIAGPDTYTGIGSIVYNIFPDRGAGYTICSGRVLDKNGLPIAGARVSAQERYWGAAQSTAVTNEKGIYALYLPSTWTGYAPYTLKAEYEEYSAELSVKAKMCISPVITEDGRFKADGSPAPAVNNLTDRNFVLALSLGPEEPEPEPEPEPTDPPEGVLLGDRFAWPIVLNGANGAHELESTAAFTKEPGEAQHTKYPESHSAWYLWTAPGSGEVTFRVSSRWKVGSTTFIGHPMIAAYRGERLSAVERIAVFERFETDDSTSVSFAAKQGERYRVVVVAYDGASDGGPYSLSWTGTLEIEPEPEIDLVAHIEIVGGEPIVRWTPDLGENYRCTILGSKDLKTWTPIDAERTRDYNFFKISAEKKND